MKIDKLPEEVLLHIFKFLGYIEWAKLIQVCSVFKGAAQNNFLWGRYYYLGNNCPVPARHYYDQTILYMNGSIPAVSSETFISLKAVIEDPYSFEGVCEESKKDRGIARMAIKGCAHTIKFAHESLKHENYLMFLPNSL